jgi:DNA-binding TFAR19-related protein (PDSD5 family)
MQTIHYDRIRLMRNNVRNRIYHFHSAHHDPEMKVIYKKAAKNRLRCLRMETPDNAGELEQYDRA